MRVRNHLKPIVLAGDLKQAFLQVRIRAEDRDILRFRWFRDTTTFEVEVLRFTRALFGLVQSPFLLGHHLQSLKGRYPKEVDKILKSLHVDDLTTCGETSNDVCHLKNMAVAIFGEAGFELHKGHSNKQTLESKASSEQEDKKQSYAKEQLGVKPSETKMLRLPWDMMTVTFPAAEHQLKRRREKLYNSFSPFMIH